jgi:hypothetical protein
MLNSIKVLVGKGGAQVYRGAGVKWTTATAVSWVSVWY